MTIKKSYIELIEKYDGVLRGLWVQPFFLDILTNYFQLLDEVEYDTAIISEASYIRKTLEVNKSKEEVKTILFTDTPIEYVQEAIKQVARAGSIYESLYSSGINWEKKVGDMDA